MEHVTKCNRVAHCCVFYHFWTTKLYDTQEEDISGFQTNNTYKTFFLNLHCPAVLVKYFNYVKKLNYVFEFFKTNIKLSVALRPLVPTRRSREALRDRVVLVWSFHAICWQ